MPRTIALDFDGVIHTYESGWCGPVPTDPPVEGAREAIAAMREAGYHVVVMSTRCETPEGLDGVRAWLRLHGIEVDGVTHEKCKAVLYVDDRGYRFNGRWQDVVTFITSGGLDPWNKRGRRGSP